VVLPTGLTSAVNTTAKTVTISGTPTASGTYTITTSGHTPCTAATISGTVTVTLTTVSAASSTPTLCINTALTAITHTTTGATGFQNNTAGSNGLPAGVKTGFCCHRLLLVVHQPLQEHLTIAFH
jgi:hypothetical protein